MTDVVIVAGRQNPVGQSAVPLSNPVVDTVVHWVLKRP